MAAPDPPSTPRPLATLLAGEGSARAVGGNAPLRLDTPGRAWLVSRGAVEIFAATATGRRLHLATVAAGDMLFAVGAEPRPGAARPETAATAESLVAVAHPGTELVETTATALTRLARDPDNVSALASAVEAWVRALFRRIPRREAPQRFTELHAGAEARLTAVGEAAGTAGGVVWVRHVNGGSRFLGRDELALDPAAPLFPISPETWLVADGETTLSGVATGHLLRSGTLWEGVACFHALFLRYVALTVAQDEAAERERLARRSALDRETVAGAYARLASVLAPGKEEPAAHPFALGDAADPLFAACRLVAGAQGVDLRLPPEQLTGGAGWRLRRICDASRVRYRRLLLRDDWWRRDNGPLLAFVEESPAEEGSAKVRRPVALLPLSPQSYEQVDPATGLRTPVDAAAAAEFAGDAYMFYSPLPDRPVRPGDLLRLAFRDRGRDLLTIALMGLGGGLLSVLVPIITEQLFGRVIPSADRSQLLQMTLALIAAGVGAAAFQITRSIAVLRLTGKVDGSVQAAVWDRLLSLPSAFFRRYTVGDLTTRAMGVDTIRTLLLGNATSSFLGLVFSLFSFALLFYYSVELALMATGLIAALSVVTAALAYLQVRHQRELLRIQGQIASLVFGLIRGISKLRTSGAEKRAFALWAGSFTEQRQLAFRVRQLANIQVAWNAVYGVAASLALFAMLGFALEDGMAVSRFLAFSAAFGQVQAAALTFVGLLSSLLEIVPVYERLQPILTEVPEVDAAKLDPGELSGDVELGHVSFRYRADGPLILDDVTLRARAGEFVALVGPSGSGKSTCLRLLLGFESPGAGSIYYDGQDLASLDLQALRRQIGVVLQNSRPMTGDIATNILGSSNLGLDAAWEAARMAGLEADVKAMPMGMHTLISESAGTFSGGQLQRLMIARAVVNRPRLVFFDEATSALDNRTQDTVRQSLDRLKATRIVVAHRLSTIRRADRIYVLVKGRIVEEGSYAELLERGGIFAELVARQVE